MSTIVFFGDSIIALKEGKTRASQYFAQCFPQHRVLNRGIGGEDTDLARKRFAADVLAEAPDVVVFSFGINDAAIDVYKGRTEPRVPLNRYLENLRHFMVSARQQGATPLFFTPPPMVLTQELRAYYGGEPYLSKGFNFVLDEYIAAAKKLAEEEHCLVADVNSMLRRQADFTYCGLLALSSDGMHPDDLAQEMIARELCKALEGVQGVFPQEKRSSFKPGELWPDNHGIHINAHGGGLLRMGDDWYWFGEHKIEGRAGNLAHVGVHVYHSTDLYNWEDGGIAFDIRTCPRMMPGVNVIERPKVLYCKATGKYVMWFHYENQIPYTAAEVGVAVSDTPMGPYVFQSRFRPCQGSYPVNPPEPDEPRPEDEVDHIREGALLGQQSRDMTLFLDDDGKAYLIHSSERNLTLHVAELTPDFTGCTGKFWRILPRHRLEAPAIIKKDGRYIMIASGLSGWSPNPGHAAVAPHIWGPWTELNNPAVDEDKETTYHSQSTYAFEYKGRYILMADRWTPDNAIDGRYLWMPIQFQGDQPIIHTPVEWSL